MFKQNHLNVYIRMISLLCFFIFHLNIKMMPVCLTCMRCIVYRMNGLEKVNFDELDKKDAEYAHCFESRRSGYDQSRTVLTLSKSSWDTVGLYCVCAFRKVKNSWDSKGNPVYEFDDEQV